MQKHQVLLRRSRGAIYYIAIASDAHIGKLTRTVALADNWNTKTQKAESARIQNEIDGLHEHGEKLDQAHQLISKELHDIKTSKSWRMVSRAQKLKHRLTNIKK